MRSIAIKTTLSRWTNYTSSFKIFWTCDWFGTKRNFFSSSPNLSLNTQQQQLTQEVNLSSQKSTSGTTKKSSSKKKTDEEDDAGDDDDDGAVSIPPPPDPNAPPQYHLAYGNRLGSVPKCRGCNNKIIDRKQLRIQVTGTYAPKTAPRVAKVNFCIDIACIEKGIYTDLKRRDPVVIYPTFDGRIQIPPELKGKVNVSKLPQLDGCVWLEE